MASTQKTSEPRFNKRYFKEKCQILDITQRRVAKILGVDPATVSVLFSGRRKMQLKEAVALAKLFGVTIDEVLNAAGISTTLVSSSASATLKIGGWVDGGGRVHVGGVNGVKTAPAIPFGGIQKGVRVVRCQTTGGGPLEAIDGALIYYIPTHTLAPDCLGRLCVSGVEGEGEFLATLKRGYGPGTYNLVDLGGRILLESVSVDWAVPVVWVKL